jgi:beta-1,4-mannosyltransferase
VTLYDRPPAVFQPISVLESHQLFASLAKQYPVFRANDGSINTVFTDLLSDGNAVWRKDRPALIVSSTSWTDDEDFSVLLSALQGSIFKIVTDCGLDGPGSNPGGDEIFRPSRPALGLTQRPVKWVLGLSRG